MAFFSKKDAFRDTHRVTGTSVSETSRTPVRMPISPRRALDRDKPATSPATSPVNMSDAVLHLLDPARPDPSALSHLTREERERADRFVFRKDAERWSFYRAGLRRILGDHLGIDPSAVVLRETRWGKPVLEPPFDAVHFNLSHSDDLAAVVVSEGGPVGIDLEPLDRASSLLECVDIFCHPREIESLPEDPESRARRLLEIWTGKEALLKALGTGLSFPPQQLRVEDGRGMADTDLPGVSELRLVIPTHPRTVAHRLAVALTPESRACRWHRGASPH